MRVGEALPFRAGRWCLLVGITSHNSRHQTANNSKVSELLILSEKQVYIILALGSVTATRLLHLVSWLKNLARRVCVREATKKGTQAANLEGLRNFLSLPLSYSLADLSPHRLLKVQSWGGLAGECVCLSTPVLSSLSDCCCCSPMLSGLGVC